MSLREMSENHPAVPSGGINRVFLGKYYENYKISRLGDTYEQVNSKYDSKKLSDLSLIFKQIGRAHV